MPTRVRKVAAPPRLSPTVLWTEDEQPWSLADLLALNEALEATETALQGMSMIKHIDVVLQIDDKVVAAHHDGLKWWVKLK